MKRDGITICGAYGLGNAGDEAILRAIVGQLHREHPERTITVISAGKARTGLPGTQIIPRRYIWRWLHQLRRTKLFISGGGSLLQDISSRRSLLYYLYTIAAAHRRGAAVMLYSCGIGPLHRFGSCYMTKKVLNRCADSITLRDRDSMEFLRRLGVRDALLHLAADPVFAEQAAPFEGGDKLGIVLRPWKQPAENASVLADAILRTARKYHLRPVFLCFGEGDREAAEQVMSLLPQEMRVLRDDADVSGCGLVISMRLHGLIFAANAALPCVGISYDPKVRGLCAEMDIPCADVDALSADGLCSMADAAMSGTQPQRLQKLQLMKQRAQCSAEQAEALLAVGN